MKKNFALCFANLLLILFFSSCHNEGLESNEDLSVNKGTYTEKVDLQELLDKIGTRNTELIELITNNPISKLKNQEFLKSNLETSNIFFDTNHIQAIKNDKNQAVYMIPVYYNKNQDPNLYTLTINIDKKIIDTKLTTLEIHNDGSTQHRVQNFEYSIKKSLTSKVKSYECYCMVNLVDCICCTSHNSAGCDHPVILIDCRSCNGTSGTSTGSETPTNTTIATVWSNSAGYGYSYTQTGSSIYISLTKIFNPTYTFSALQKYNIVNNTAISGTLLSFLNAEGSTQANKDFVVSVINAVEEGTVATFQDVTVLINAYIEAQKFLTFKNDYLATHPNTTLEQFANWFMGTPEGQDGEYDATFWENPNLTFQKQSLPQFSNFLMNYPSHTDALYTTPSQMFNSVGGMPLSIYNANPVLNGNTCALRVSKALNYSGVIIPNISGKTFKGTDNKYYFLGAANLMAWMKKTFGIPTGSNYLTGSQGGTNGVNFPTLLKGKEGIYILIPNNPGKSGFSASGHADLFFANDCDGGCYFGARGGVKEILFWELK